MCDYCEKTKMIKPYTAFRIEKYAGVWAITNFGISNSEWFEINYCPMCGRKLIGSEK